MVSGTGHELLLVAAVAALGAAGLRIAGRLGGDGLVRVVGAAPIATSFAVLEALGLGLVSRGSSPWLLAGAAILTFGLTRLALAGRGRPAPPSLRLSAGRWWAERTRVERVAWGAAAGAWVAICAWLVANPTIGIDAALYHLNDVAAWVQNGRPGSTVSLSYDLPFGSYPLTNEVALAWIAGISRGFAGPTLWSPSLYVLLLAAGWVGLRGLRVPAVVRRPVHERGGNIRWSCRRSRPRNRSAWRCWLAVCGALVSWSIERPRLLGAAPARGGPSGRDEDDRGAGGRLQLWQAGASTGEGFGVCRRGSGRRCRGRGWSGGLSFVRDFVEHGSPLWPYVSRRGGDPVPASSCRCGRRFCPAAGDDRRAGQGLPGLVTWQLGGCVDPPRRQVCSAR